MCIRDRYKCTQCSDYNLCEACESKEIHSHQFIKYNKPVAIPQPATYIRSYSVYSTPQSLFDTLVQGAKELLGFNKLMNRDEQMAVATCSKVQRIVGPLGGVATVELKFRNDSRRSWPAKCFLRKKVGDIQFYPLIIQSDLKPGETFSILIPISLPMKEGEYILQLQLSNEKAYFGEPVTLKITVEQPVITKDTSDLMHYQAFSMELEGVGSLDECFEALKKTEGDMEEAIEMLKHHK
eukprot:TRINITY_DN7125_c0_g1_i3.p1 TRINITY_DN7125_c0_g1~~TRINITY_DN7125_c0_g1_i3.p1  ORF type:complete len:238 (+),score=41.80 TRINITY_DN7125_c0_g1_i3:73-786(+)